MNGYLELSPSALSRSVKQLEDSLGEPLFTREGRRIRLNRAGELLLVAVRDAMRRIDDGIEHVGQPSIERIRIAGAVAWIQLIVLPALLDGQTEPVVTVDIVDIAVQDVPGALLRGEIDLALCETIRPNDQLIVESLGEVRRAVCWSKHVDDDEALPFACFAEDGADTSIGRGHGRIALRTTSLCLAIEACRCGRMRAVLPIAIARANRLRTRTPRDLTVSHLYLVQRSPLTESPVAPFVARIKLHAGGILGAAKSVDVPP